MVQIDLFVAYGMSSGLAIAAGEQLAAESDRWANRYAMATLSWLTLFLAPQVLYLLWQYPCWETMFMASGHAAIPAWLAAGYPIAIGVVGMAGFFSTAQLLRAGKARHAWLQAIGGVLAAVFFATYGWDGTGYTRMLYAGTCADWADGRVFGVLEFLGAPVARDLLWLETLAMVPYAALVVHWRRSGAPRD